LETQAQRQQFARTGWGLERRAAALERFLERHSTWVLVLWSVVYFGGTMLRAHAYPFWYDEIETIVEARQPTISSAIHALSDVDWMSPVNRVVFYFTHRLLGDGEVAFRIPAMIAFWVFSICLFLLARRRVSILFALMAMLLPFASAFQAYSYEARSYAFMLGFGGIALLSWQAAAEGAGRPWSLAGLAAGIAGAVAFHYWAVLIYLPIGGAEVYRSVRRRGIDWPVWAALLAGGMSLAASLPLILYGLRTWSLGGADFQAHPRSYLEFYRVEFRVFGAFAVPAAVALAAWFALGGRKEEPAGARRPTIPDYEWVATSLLMLIPVAAVSIALASPHKTFMLRYAALAAAGYALLGSFLAAHFAGRRSAVGVACVVGALAPFTYLMTHPGHYRNRFEQAVLLKPALEKDLVVVGSPPQFLELWYYTPDGLKPHLLVIPRDARRGWEYPFLDRFRDLGFLVAAYRDFALPGRSFLLYTEGDSGTVIQRRTLQEGGQVETVASSGNEKLLRVHVADRPALRSNP
jgi:hypothetical protein